MFVTDFEYNADVELESEKSSDLARFGRWMTEPRTDADRFVVVCEECPDEDDACRCCWMFSSIRFRDRCAVSTLSMNFFEIEDEELEPDGWYNRLLDEYIPPFDNGALVKSWFDAADDGLDETSRLLELQYPEPRLFPFTSPVITSRSDLSSSIFISIIISEL